VLAGRNVWGGSGRRENVLTKCPSPKVKAKARDSYVELLTGMKPDQPRFTIIESGS